MDNHKDDLERQVCAALRATHEQYLLMDQLVDVMLEKQTRFQPIDAEMRLLETAKKEVATMELAHTEVKTSYRRAHASASHEIKTLSAESTRLLTKTIKKVETLENATRASQQKLLPQIDKSVRANQMQKAYGVG